ncbi:hypothetical protein WOLCODRAFT_164384 [Wolfiporia cocos MD-104 SS10]|uniref:Uncharacterized protein n=1 Tax=Wolfiporia cocos (strain MD-104) TaxID=742152 RepID=A0A2H3JMF5_WOLCO|nr:hypothetical protein WOLCODRAFT_164384 [Wolfiporia cocos MD-104 SS10]
MDATVTAVPAQPAAPAPAAPTDGPVPMSFPAILRTPGLSDRFAHLRPAVGDRVVVPAVLKRNRRDDKEGKRWVRRKENAQFVGNAHIVPPTKRDYAIPLPEKTPTFPAPLPPYIPRSVPIPPSAPPTHEPSSAAAGRFSLSLKGMRRTLRRAGPRTEALVRDVEGALLAWLADNVLLAPDDAAPLAFPGVPLGETGVVHEVQRAPLRLVWSVPDDAFARYVVHCCARFHGVVSFSKDDPPHRLTHLLRPNVTRPTRAPAARRAAPALDTPPATDLSEYHSSDATSDAYLSSDAASDVGSERDPDETFRLEAIAEASAPPSPALAPRAPQLLSDDEWSVVDADAESGDGSDIDADVARGMRGLTLRDANRGEGLGLGMAPRARRPVPDSVDYRAPRAASSPSPSPAARRTRVRRVDPPRALVDAGGERAQRSFYEYLYG